MRRRKNLNRCVITIPKHWGDVGTPWGHTLTVYLYAHPDGRLLLSWTIPKGWRIASSGAYALGNAPAITRTNDDIRALLDKTSEELPDTTLDDWDSYCAWWQAQSPPLTHDPDYGRDHFFSAWQET